MTQRSSVKITSSIGVLLVFAILLLANLLLSTLRLRLDFTEDRIHTLSKGAETLLRSLDRPVTLKFYASRSGEQVPVPFRQYVQRIQDLLREIELRSNGNVVLEVYDPRPDSDEEEWAQKYGLAGQNVGIAGIGQTLYVGLVASSGANEAVLPVLSPNLENRIEYEVMRLIHSVARPGRPSLGLITSLPVLGGGQAPLGSRAPAQGWFLGRELQSNYRLTTLQPTLAEIPSDLDAVLLIHPKNVPDTLLFALDQYLLRGGRLIAYLDPLSVTEQDVAQTPYFTANSNLDRLIEAWGIRFTSEHLVIDPPAATVVNLGQTGSDRLPTWLSLRDPSINPDDVVTANLNAVLLPFAGAFEGQPADRLTFEPLLSTSSQGALLDTFNAMQPSSDQLRNARPIGVQHLAVRLHGHFPTAFPNGPPPSTNPAPSSVLAEAQRPGTVILVGDADHLNDRFAIRPVNFFGQTLFEPINDNLVFALNLVEQMTGNDALIGIRTRGAVDRPFTRVIQLQEQARQRWQQKEEQLLQSLQETQLRLTQLQQARSDDQTVLLSPEQQAEIEAFRQRRFDTQRELKDVRRNLVRDIERLGFQVKAINIALMPLLVATFGLGHALYRRRKAAAKD
ncbi:MAG TPA: GldG family protein [Kiritimatiellia bacterium]|nr:GldG family protein [Kiritimatiellia bacterium]